MKQFKLIISFLIISIFQAQANNDDFNKKEVTRAILIEKFVNDPKAMAISQTRAWGINKGLAGEKLNDFVDNYAQIYDEQIEIYETGELPLSNDDKLIRDISKWSLQTLIGSYAKGTEGLTGLLVDAGYEELDDYISTDAVDFSGDFIAERAYQSAVNVEKITDIILNTENIRDGLISDIGVDIDADVDTQLARFPNIGAMLTAQDNSRSLLDITNELSSLDINLAENQVRIEEVRSEIKLILNERFDNLNDNLGLEFDSLGELISEQRDEVIQRALILEGNIGRNRELLTSYILSQQEREDRKTIELQKEIERKQKVATERATVGLAAMLLDRIEKGAGQKIIGMYNSLKQIESAIKIFKATKNIDFASFAQLSSGIANPAMAIFSLVQASGPSVDDIILSQLADISKKIDNLRVEMHERFDAVDTKLDRIFIEVSSGFDLLALKQNLNIDITIKNIQVGIDTQSLIISETKKLSDAIRDTVLVPCIKRASTLPLPDEDFIDCVSHLNNNAIVFIAREQAKYDPSSDYDSLSTLLLQEGDNNTELIQTMYELKSNTTISDEILPSRTAWLTASNWYNDFLLKDIEQTVRSKITPNIGVIINTGTQINDFHKKVLLSLNYPNNPADFSPIESYLDRGDLLLEDIDKLKNDVKETYFTDKAYYLNNIHDEFDAITSEGDIDWTLAGNDPYLTDDGAKYLFSKLPPHLRKILLNGMGNAEITVNFTGTRFHYHSCGTFGERTYTIADWDNYTLSIEITPPEEIGFNSKTITTLNFRIPWDGSGEVRLGCGGFITKGRKFKNTDGELAKAIIATVENNPNTLNIDEIPLQEVKSVWDNHRNIIGLQLLTHLEFPVYNDPLEFENAFISALLRYAFQDKLMENDPLFFISSGKAGLPSLILFSDIVNEVMVSKGEQVAVNMVWQVDKYITDEISSLHQFFNSGSFKEFLNIQQKLLNLDYSSKKLENTKLLLEIEAENYFKDSDGDGIRDNEDAFPNDPNETKDSDGDGIGDNEDAFPNDSNETKDSDGDGIGDNADSTPNGGNSDPKDNSSGGGGGSLAWVLLLLVIISSYRIRIIR
ncbi:thrombospondin type 3 repeat-containing protein [Thalassotalea psychrophila]|uniref:Thrombospondin type 3 repeat-containing protein n=1 Tax=Thalassotalea psychrophila TaxID=3065647 RepID=A0ABY9TQA4_9GAMM|nr:thrombospondin type 3 repeat-containing protein [Colwelliaceae bacterium SQ149]